MAAGGRVNGRQNMACEDLTLPRRLALRTSETRKVPGERQGVKEDRAGEW